MKKICYLVNLLVLKDLQLKDINLILTYSSFDKEKTGSTDDSKGVQDPACHFALIPWSHSTHYDTLRSESLYHKCIAMVTCCLYEAQIKLAVFPAHVRRARSPHHLMFHMCGAASPIRWLTCQADTSTMDFIIERLVSNSNSVTQVKLNLSSSRILIDTNTAHMQTLLF